MSACTRYLKVFVLSLQKHCFKLFDESFRNRYIFLIDQRTILLVTDDEKEFSSRFYTRTGSTCDNPGFIIMNLFIAIFHTAAKLRLQAFWSTQSMSSTQNLTESESVAKPMMVKTGDFQTQTEAQTEIIGPWSWRASWGWWWARDDVIESFPTRFRQQTCTTFWLLILIKKNHSDGEKVFTQNIFRNERKNWKNSRVRSA